MIEYGRVVEDSAVVAYLAFLARQMDARPDLIRGLTSLDRAEALVGDVEVNPDEDLGEDATLD